MCPLFVVRSLLSLFFEIFWWREVHVSCAHVRLGVVFLVTVLIDLDSTCLGLISGEVQVRCVCVVLCVCVVGM